MDSGLRKEGAVVTGSRKFRGQLVGLRNGYSASELISLAPLRKKLTKLPSKRKRRGKRTKTIKRKPSLLPTRRKRGDVE